jgi:pimeloyl-ACP methyl ester carboxylesterase
LRHAAPPAPAANHVHPFYFSVPDADLFAVYHEPRPGVARQSAVLLCYPLGHEYLNSHRAYRQIATLLSDAGFPVLRFDYSGCGDSGGCSEQASLEVWMRDVTQAMAELQARSGAGRLCFVGARLGATLALLAAANSAAVDSVVAWDPIVKGSAYLGELAGFHKRVLDRTESSAGEVKRPAAYDGLSLFGFGAPLRRGLGDMELLSMPRKPAEQVLLLENAAESKAGPLAARLERQGSRVERKYVPGDASWQHDFDSLLLPGPSVPAVVRWVSEVCA